MHHIRRIPQVILLFMFNHPSSTDISSPRPEAKLSSKLMSYFSVPSMSSSYSTSESSPFATMRSALVPRGVSSFSPSERSPMRVRRRVPEERVVARTGSVGCQDMEVRVIVFEGREYI